MGIFLKVIFHGCFTELINCGNKNEFNLYSKTEALVLSNSISSINYSGEYSAGVPNLGVYVYIEKKIEYDCYSTTPEKPEGCSLAASS